jgi:putative flippase GtrA
VTEASMTAAERQAPGAARALLTPQFLRYVVCSGLAAVANFAAGNLLYNLAGWDGAWGYKVSVMLGFATGMAVSYFLNRAFTFDRSGRRVHQEVRTFVVVSLGGLLLTVVLAAALRAYVTPGLVGLLPADGGLARLAGDLEASSHFLAIGLVTFYSFTFHRLCTFDRGLRHHLRRLAG